MHSNNDGMPSDWKPTPSDPFENFMNDKKIAYMQNNAVTFNTVHVTEWAHEYARKLERELTAEKQKAQKLVEALEIFLDDLSSGPKLSKVTESLRDYSTDSGDGEKG